MWRECWPTVERFLVGITFATRDDCGRLRYVDYPALRGRFDAEGIDVTQAQWQELGRMFDIARRVINEHVSRKLEEASRQ